MELKTKIYACLCAALFAVCVPLAMPAPARAGVTDDENADKPTGGSCSPDTICYLTPFFTRPVNSPYGVNRGTHAHNGLDVSYPNHSELPLQGGKTSSGGEGKCSVIMNKDGGGKDAALWNWGATGLVLRQNCGNGVEIRYFHLHQYNADRQIAISNNTGRSSGPHLHYEVWIDNVSVDPRCVLGLAKTDPRMRDCPSVIGSGPANLCDGGVRSALKAQSVKTSTANKIAPGTCNADVAGSYGNPGDLPKYPPPPGDDPEGPYVDGYDSKVGVGITYGTEGETGETGGDITTGIDSPPADLPPLSPNSSDEVQACALDTWVGMVNQAALEGRRETLMQRRFITKADSVIEYGCLPIYLKKTENEAAKIFSESSAWVNRPVDIIGKVHTMNKTLGAMSMDSSLLNVVWGAHEKYKENFNHPLQGGAEGYSVTPNAEQCADMQKVWDAARCQNYPAPDIGFPRFQDLISNDPRQFPTNMACNNTAITQKMIDAAKNKATKYDKVAPKFDYLTLDKDCKDPVPTGLTVYRHEKKATGIPAVKTYDDGVCTNAGCHYSNPGMTGAGSCEKS